MATGSAWEKEWLKAGEGWPNLHVMNLLSVCNQQGEEMEPCEELALALTRGLQLDTQRSSRDSLQCSSGYSTQTTTPCCSEDTIPSQGSQPWTDVPSKICSLSKLSAWPSCTCPPAARSCIPCSCRWLCSQLQGRVEHSHYEVPSSLECSLNFLVEYNSGFLRSVLNTLIFLYIPRMSFSLRMLPR